MDCKADKLFLIMKKITLLLILLISSITAFADTGYAYISHVEHGDGWVKVTVSASSGAFNEYPNGFYVGVRPANRYKNYSSAPFDLSRVLNWQDEKKVKLTPNNPSYTITVYCDENRIGANACSRDDFVVNFRS